MQTLFSCSGKDVTENWKSLIALSAREFFDGDFEVDSADGLEVTVEKALKYPIALMRMTVRSPIAYRRSWQHIRKNKVGVRLIWFVRRGTLRVNRSQGTCVVAAGQAGVQDSGAPFHVKLSCDRDGVHESFIALVPAHLFLAHLSGADRLAGPIDLGTEDGQIVERLLELLAGSGEVLTRNTAKPLVESFLEAIGDRIGCRQTALPRRQTMADRRLADIENHILMNLADSNLCYDRVAVSCGISPRYLCYVLKVNNTSFASLLWGHRLNKARDLLVSSGARGFSIHEIAHMSGFKSAAHFSRMFKSAFGCPPRDYRADKGNFEPAESREDHASGALDDQAAA
jgi:AraC family transcriptional regulator, positive regulator of tynA and feaB